MFFTVAITVYKKDQIFLPRALTCLLNQQFQGFEVIVVVDGETPLAPYDPIETCRQTVPAQVVYRPKSGTMAFRERHHALQLAKGKYIAWVNVDNLLYPNWLLNHLNNVSRNDGAISVVNIQYWLFNSYWGKLPKALVYGSVDLLNYALPVDLARRMDVFGPDEERVHHADWTAFERCVREAPVVWDPDQPVCACHY